MRICVIVGTYQSGMASLEMGNFQMAWLIIFSKNKSVLIEKYLFLSIKFQLI